MLKSVLFGTLCLFSHTVYAECTTRYSECVQQSKEDGVFVSGDMRGSIVETRNGIYVTDLKIYNDNPNRSVLQVIASQNTKKPVIIENIEIHSKNADIYSNTGSASLVDLQLHNDNINTVEDISIYTSGYNRYVSNSNTLQNSAGTFSLQGTGNSVSNVDINRIVINSSGYDVNTSIQNLP